tara:strand:- start:2371 stop:2664 length:294 start_codon:yes stop_codon:yes gene_type:complete
MNVKVSYTVDIEEVPSLVQDLLASCQQELVALSNTKLNIFEAEALLKKVAQVRKRLNWIDSRLEDSSNILVGYHNTNSEPSFDQEEPPQEDFEDEHQ